MKTNNKTLVTSGALLALSIMLVAGLSFASAHTGETREENGYEKRHLTSEERIERKAELLGITPENLKERLDAGETWKEIAESLGLTEEDIKTRVKEHALEHVDELLADGVISEERADELKERIEAGDFPHKGKKFHRGFHKGYHMGFKHGSASDIDVVE